MPALFNLFWALGGRFGAIVLFLRCAPWVPMISLFNCNLCIPIAPVWMCCAASLFCPAVVQLWTIALQCWQDRCYL